MSASAQAKTDRYRTKNWEKYMFTSARSAAKARGLVFDLESPQQILEIWGQQGGKCYWFGIDMEPSSKPRHPNKPSLDRLDGGVGYVPGNIVLCCLAANLGRNNVPVEVWADFCRRIRGTT